MNESQLNALFQRAKNLLSEMVNKGCSHPASEALQSAYKEQTGRDVWIFVEINSRGFPIYMQTDSYRLVKNKLLSRLRQIARKELGEQDPEPEISQDFDPLSQWIENQLSQGVAPETLREIGYSI